MERHFSWQMIPNHTYSLGFHKITENTAVILTLGDICSKINTQVNLRNFRSISSQRRISFTNLRWKALTSGFNWKHRSDILRPWKYSWRNGRLARQPVTKLQTVLPVPNDRCISPSSDYKYTKLSYTWLPTSLNCISPCFDTDGWFISKLHQPQFWL